MNHQIDAALLRTFQEIGRALVEQHVISARGGNMSLRAEGGSTVITRHDSMNAYLGAMDFTRIDPDGASSGPEPSSDTSVHLAVYRARGPGAVVHAHPRHAVALSLTRAQIEPINLEGRLHLGAIPVVAPGMAVEVAEPVADALSSARVCMVEGHGCYAYGEDLWTAFQWVTVLEEACQILFLHEALSKSGR